MTSTTKLSQLAAQSPIGTNAINIGNNGLALLKGGYYPAAEKYLTRALEIDPTLITLYADLALAYNFNNKPYHAVVVGFEALKKLPDQFVNFNWIFQQTPIATYNPLYREVMEYLLANNLYSDALAGVFYRILMSDPRYVDLNDKDPAVAIACMDDVMCHVLCKSPVVDIIFENHLTIFRDYLAQNPAADFGSDPFHKVRASLIAQGLLNEFIWDTPDVLPDAPIERFLYEDISVHDMQAAQDVLASIKFAPARAFITDHLNFREQLPELLDSIPSFGTMQNETSQKVRQQYEENPYPRWTQAAHKQNGKTEHTIPAIQHVQKTAKDVLIAGCGTGQHIMFAQDSYVRANMSAIDLSKTSMAYAKYRFNTLNIPLPEMHHGDILDVQSLNRTFDVIECSGVLHHMKDPLAGLDSLLSILKPGGHLHLGLYSEIARSDVHKTREHIAEQHYGSDIKGIRACRREVITNPDMQYPFLIYSRDFYVTSPCRDLIFHVQEHNYTLGAIKQILHDRGLEFIGFDIPFPSMLASFYQVCGHEADLHSLDNWEKTENAVPHIFRTMYNFWVRKPVQH